MNRRKARRVRLNKYLGVIWTDIDPQGQTPSNHLVGKPAEFGDQNLDSAIFRTLNKVVDKMVVDGPKRYSSDLRNRHRPLKSVSSKTSKCRAVKMTQGGKV